jgi:hypothetical protein
VLASCCLVGEQDAGCHALGAQTSSSGASSFLVGGGRERATGRALGGLCLCPLLSFLRLVDLVSRFFLDGNTS